MSVFSSICCLLSIATVITAYPKIEHRADDAYGSSSSSSGSNPASSGFQQLQSQFSQYGGNIPNGIPNSSQFDYRQCFEQVVGQSSSSGSSPSSSSSSSAYPKAPSYPSYPTPDQFQKIRECFEKKIQQQQSSSGSSS